MEPGANPGRRLWGPLTTIRRDDDGPERDRRTGRAIYRPRVADRAAHSGGRASVPGHLLERSWQTAEGRDRRDALYRRFIRTERKSVVEGTRVYGRECHRGGSSMK